ncbi:MAG: calcium-binding protein, partial [Actinobacteria bacterium]|nr:calcium-binding protein [Actinomycetota bacterium]
MARSRIRKLAAASAVAVVALLSWGGPAGGAGALCFGAAPTITGTPGDDALVGTPGDDVIVGLGGDDSI